MVAEAPDPHNGDLGRLEEVRNGLIGPYTIGYRGRNNRELLTMFA